MRTTIDKYNRLCDMNLIQKSRYNINDKISLIVQEVQDYIDLCEKRAGEMLGYDCSQSLHDETKNVSYYADEKS